MSCTDSAGKTIPCSTAQGGAGTGNRLTVALTERFSFMTPLINNLFGGGLDMTASATTAVLGVAANGESSGTTCTTPPTANPFTPVASGMTVSVDASASQPDSGVCAISGYNWDFAVTPEPFPPITGKTATYTYTSPGTYIITLEVTNQAGTDTVQASITVGAGPTPTPTPTPAPTPTATPAPVCNFDADFAYTIQSGNKVTFTGSYSGSPVPLTWAWNFGDATTSNVQNPPQHHYSGGSPRTVTLTITNGTCSDTESKLVDP